MRKTDSDGLIEIDMNNPKFQDDLFSLEKPERHSAMETLKKLRRMTWNQVYRDNGLKWERIESVTPPPGVSAIYSLRITQARRATAYRDAGIIRLLSIPPDHDATYGKK